MELVEVPRDVTFTGVETSFAFVVLFFGFVFVFVFFRGEDGGDESGLVVIAFKGLCFFGDDEVDDGGFVAMSGFPVSATCVVCENDPRRILHD